MSFSFNSVPTLSNPYFSYDPRAFQMKYISASALAAMASRV